MADKKYPVLYATSIKGTIFVEYTIQFISIYIIIRN